MPSAERRRMRRHFLIHSPLVRQDRTFEKHSKREGVRGAVLCLVLLVRAAGWTLNLVCSCGGPFGALNVSRYRRARCASRLIRCIGRVEEKNAISDQSGRRCRRAARHSMPTHDTTSVTTSLYEGARAHVQALRLVRRRLGPEEAVGRRRSTPCGNWWRACMSFFNSTTRVLSQLKPLAPIEPRLGRSQLVAQY